MDLNALRAGVEGSSIQNESSKRKGNQVKKVKGKRKNKKKKKNANGKIL